MSAAVGCSMGDDTDDFTNMLDALVAKQMREEYLHASEYDKLKASKIKTHGEMILDKFWESASNKPNPLTYPDKYIDIISNPSGRDTWADIFVKQQLSNPPKKIEPFPDDTGYIPIYTPYHCTEEYIDFLFLNQFGVRCEASHAYDNDCWILQLGRGHKSLIDTDTGLMLISQHNAFKDLSGISRANVLDSDRFIFPKNKLVVEQFLYIIKSIQCEPTQLTKYELNDTQSHIDAIFNYKVDADLSRMRKTCYISSMKHNQKDTP